MKKIVFSLLVVLFFISCEEMEEFQSNPNAADKGVPSLFLTELEKNLFNDMTGFDPNLAARYKVGFSYHGEYAQYYKWSTGGMNEYSQIKNADEMIKWADDNNSYVAIGKLFKVINYYWLTNRFGDVPFTEALQLEGGITRPKYDLQEDIYKNMLAELEEANNLIAASKADIEGDFVYNGDVEKWQKFINSFKLRVLLSLSNKDGNTKLNPRAKFAEMMNNPAKYPIFESNADNAQRPTNSVIPHPFYNDQAVILYYGLEKGFVDSLKARKDPRLFHYAEITDKARRDGMSPYNFNSYEGLPGSAPNDQNTANMLIASIPNRNYFDLEDYEPVLFMGYYEVMFLVAEGIARGWWTGGDAEEYYVNGINGSMAYYNINPDTISRYLVEPNVQYDNSNGLEMILVQKYLGGFNNSGWERFYSQRRTGIPIFDVSGDGVPNNQIATRWRYPNSEFTLNETNVTQAVNRQFPDGDNIYGKLWLLEIE